MVEELGIFRDEFSLLLERKGIKLWRLGILNSY
jgi:hypothetical protein